MSRNKTLPGTSIFLTIVSAIGFKRGVQDVIEEAGQPSEPVSPHTFAMPDDENTKTIARVGLGLLLALWMVIILIYPFFSYLKYHRTGGKDPARTLPYLPKLPPEPRNVNEPYQALEKFQKIQQGQLENYYWIDRNKGIVAIPIQRAMQIIAQRGLPVSKPAPPNEYYAPVAGSMRTGFEDKTEPDRQ
jgi:hypothetical protein